MNFLDHLATLDAAGLADELRSAAQRAHVADLVVEIAPTRGFRVVREGNAATGVLLSRHAIIGVLVCLVRINAPTAFWKEVLS